MHLYLCHVIGTILAFQLTDNDYLDVQQDFLMMVNLNYLKSIGYWSLIKIIPWSLMGLLECLSGLYLGDLMLCSFSCRQSLRLKISPNVSNYVLYEGLVLKFLLCRQELA